VKAFRGKILVIRGGAIGDFILTLPALAALRQQFPEAHLEVLGYPHIIELAVAGGLVDRAQSIEARALAAFFARNGELSEDMADYFSEFDLIVSYLYDPDYVFQTNVGRCSFAQFIGAPHRPDEHLGISASKIFLKPLERLAIFEADYVPRLQIGDSQTVYGGPEQLEQKSAGIRKTPPWVALHPGSGSETKNWPEASWADLLQDLVNLTDYQLLVVGGQAEGERLQRLTAALPPCRSRIAQNLPLAELGRLLQTCSAFVGHDSGISHLAAALGLPGLVLWAQTVESVWRPPSPKVVVLRDPRGIDYLSPGAVLAELSGILESPGAAGGG